MSTAVATAQLNEIAAQWRTARHLYPVYAAVVRQHGIAQEPCRELEYPVDRPEPQAVARFQRWFDEADEKIEIWQLRQVLQTSGLGTEPVLRTLLERFLEKESKGAADRDKVDFLLVQYFFQCAPSSLHSKEVELDEVAEVLEPVLGECAAETPRWAEPLDGLIAELKQCESMKDLLGRKILERGRRLKSDAGEMFYGASALLAFTRFNFIARGTLVKLIHHDLHGIRFALHGLEQRGQRTLDCSAAGLGAEETTENARRFCHEWKAMFRAAYAAGAPFQPLIQLREVLEAALAAPAPAPPAVAAEPAPAPVETPEQPVLRGIEAPAAEKPAEAVPAEKVVEAAAPAVAEQKPKPPAQESKPAARTAEPKKAVVAAQPAAAKAAAVPQAAPAADVETCVEQIATQLFKISAKKGVTVTSIVVEGHNLMLSSWEAAAYIEGGDDISDALQRGVAARALLVRAAEQRKAGEAVEIKPVLAAAHQEAAALQAMVAVAKEKKNVDAAVNLAATARRLLGLMQELEKG